MDITDGGVHDGSLGICSRQFGNGPFTSLDQQNSHNTTLWLRGSSIYWGDWKLIKDGSIWWDTHLRHMDITEPVWTNRTVTTQLCDWQLRWSSMYWGYWKLIKGQYDEIHISDTWISLMVVSMMAPWASAAGSLGMGPSPLWTNRTVTTQLCDWDDPLYIEEIESWSRMDKYDEIHICCNIGVE